MAKGPSTAQTKDVVVRVELPDDDRARDASLAVYAFSRGGKLLDVKHLDAKGQTTLRVPSGAETANVRLVVGPRIEREAATVLELLRRGGVERHLRVDPKLDRFAIDIPIHIDKVLCWLIPFCAVNGTVVKRSEISGVPLELPVCNATVEIYEVDPIHIVIWKLPKLEIDRLREVILHPIPLPDPPPEPIPGPFPGPFPGQDPGPFFPRSAPALPKRFAKELTRHLPLEQPTAEHRHNEAAIALSQAREAGELQFAARAAGDREFRQALIEHSVLIRPIICIFWPRFFTMQKIATAKTDECGHFHTRFFVGCRNPDRPDLYFKVKQRLFGFFNVTIYAPTPVPCYTWWNYPCGSEVTIVTHHPLAQTCAPCAPVVAGDNWVLFVAIGATSLNAIYGASDALKGSVDAANRGLTKNGAPFGATLRPQLLFDNALRETLGVKYYRLSWQRDGEADWHQMLADVHRHYTYELAGEPVGDLYKLGPLSPPEAPKPDLFEIPPAVAPKGGTWGPVIAPTDYENGSFNTSLPAPGLPYEFNGSQPGTDSSGKFKIKLELFDNAGNPVDIGVSGIKYFVPDLDDLNGVITTTEAAPLGLVVGSAMIMTVHVDNNPTYAEIDAPTIGGAFADPCCGVLEFQPGATVTIPWRAKHRNGFASYAFSTKRVDETIFSANGPVGLVGSHSGTKGAQAMMDENLPVGCDPGGCDVAAFASALYVTAMATDGWSRLWSLDSGDFEAFALKKGAIEP
jgi:hypothetical protein